jgi:hypothetical protein
LFFLRLDPQVTVLSQELQQLSFSKPQVAWWHTLQDSHSVYHYPRSFFKQVVHFRVIVVMSYGNWDSWIGYGILYDRSFVCVAKTTYNMSIWFISNF